MNEIKHILAALLCAAEDTGYYLGEDTERYLEALSRQRVLRDELLEAIEKEKET